MTVQNEKQQPTQLNDLPPLPTEAEVPFPCLAPPSPEELSSELPGFYRLPIDRRRAKIAGLTDLTTAEVRILCGDDGLGTDQANRMVENVLGVFGMPLGLCANLRVDGRDRLVPMAIEEASVVAAASRAGGSGRSPGRARP